ncbi:MAG: ATP-NAD kinase family protein [Desulfurococcaceae archaeon]
MAGMGGRVGLKGTDGDVYKLAIEKGAEPIAPKRALEFLNNIRIHNFTIISAPGVMGSEVVEKSVHRDKLVGIVGQISLPTTCKDTQRIAREMIGKVDIIIFVGGDGTARDICLAINTSLPVIGVPSGVKMYSSVFAVSPRAAAMLFEHFVKGETEIVEREVLDIDEDAFRRNELIVKLYCYLKMPIYSWLVQSAKTTYDSLDDEAKEAIADYVIESMEPHIPYVLGPGSTVKTICKKLNIECTLLGVDVLVNGKIIAKDVGEKELLDILSRYGRVKLVVSPIGNQGFLFGRGNQQISPLVLSRIQRDDIIVIATRRKIMDIKNLLIDTGDQELDRKLSGYYKVLIDYNRFMVVKAVSY